MNNPYRTGERRRQGVRAIDSSLGFGRFRWLGETMAHRRLPRSVAWSRHRERSVIRAVEALKQESRYSNVSSDRKDSTHGLG